MSERDTGHLGSGFAHIVFNSIICICFGGGGWYLFFFLAVLSLHCFVHAFSSCGKQELLYNCSVHASMVASLVTQHGLSRYGARA